MMFCLFAAMRAVQHYMFLRSRIQNSKLELGRRVNGASALTLLNKPSKQGCASR